MLQPCSGLLQKYFGCLFRNLESICKFDCAVEVGWLVGDGAGGKVADVVVWEVDDQEIFKHLSERLFGFDHPLKSVDAYVLAPQLDSLLLPVSQEIVLGHFPLVTYQRYELKILFPLDLPQTMLNDIVHCIVRVLVPPPFLSGTADRLRVVSTRSIPARIQLKGGTFSVGTQLRSGKEVQFSEGHFTFFSLREVGEGGWVVGDLMEGSWLVREVQAREEGVLMMNRHFFLVKVLWVVGVRLVENVLFNHYSFINPKGMLRCYKSRFNLQMSREYNLHLGSCTKLLKFMIQFLLYFGVSQ